MIKEEQANFLRKVAKESIKNAEQFVDDAEVLLRKKSYGHAFALAVLGEEEMAKAIMYSIAAEGIIGIKGKWAKDLRKHLWKQSIAVSITIMYELILMLEEAADSAKKETKGNVRRFKQIWKKKFSEILQEEAKLAAQERGEFFEHLEPFAKLQLRREKAMYVDGDLKELKISSPRKFKKSNAKRHISHVKERLKILKHEIGRKMDALDKEMAHSVMKIVLGNKSEEQKKKLLEWYGISEKELENVERSHHIRLE